MLTKKVILGVISILEEKILEVREDTIIYENGIEISRTFFRYVSNPGDDISNKPQTIQDLANLLWTPEVIEEWKESNKLNPLFPPSGSL